MRSSTLRAPGLFARYVLIGAVCVAAVAACGTVSSTSPSGASSPAAAPAPSAASSPAAPKVSLDITVLGTPGTTARHWTLTCEPTGGTHPDAAAACIALLQAKSPFAPVPRGIECPMILASSGEATIQGTYFGQPVNTTIRDGGCTLSRWAELGQLVG
jgi:hypothetical protein